MEINRIVLIALGLLTLARLILLPVTELDADEAYVALCATRPDWHYMESGPLPPLLSKLGISIFGRNEFGHRFFAPFLALGMTLAGGSLAAGIASGRASAWAMAGFALLPAMAVVSTRLTVETLGAFFFTILAWSIWTGLHSHRASHRSWAVAGVSAAGALLCHPSNLIPLILSCCLLMTVPRWRRNLLRRKFLLIFLPIASMGLIPYFLWDEHLRLLATLHWRHGLGAGLSLAGVADLLRRAIFAYTPLVGAGLLWIIYWDLRHNRNSLGARYGIAFSLPLILYALGLSFLGKPSPILLLPAALPLLARFALAWPSVPVGHSLKIAVRTTALAFSALFSLLVSQTDLVRRAGMTWSFLDTAPRGGGSSYWTPWTEDPTGGLRGWREMALFVDHVRSESAAPSDDLPILIAASPQVAFLLAFYLPMDEEIRIQSKGRKSDPLSSRGPPSPPVFDVAGQHPTSPLLGWRRYDRRGHSDDLISRETTGKPFARSSLFGGRALYICTPSPLSSEALPPEIEDAFLTVWPAASANIMRGGEPLRSLTIYTCDGFRETEL